MCSGVNPKRISSIREAELQKRLNEAFANDRSHTRMMSENEK